jgi:hypothetical protein
MRFIKEAKRSDNLIAMSTRQTDTVFVIQSPSLATRVLGKEDELECLLTVRY